MADHFEDEVIYSYSRKQAIEDGVLIDLSQDAREAGIKLPTAVTQGVFGVLSDLSTPGQDLKGRIWDMLMIFCLHAKKTDGEEIHFAPLFCKYGSQTPEPVKMWAKCGPGDDGSPVITIMLVGED